MPEPHRRRHDEDDASVQNASDRRLSHFGNVGNAPATRVNTDGPRHGVERYALGKDEINQAHEEKGDAGEDESQRERRYQVEVQRPTPEDIRVWMLLATSSLAQVPPKADKSDQCERHPVDDTSDRLAGAAELTGKDQVPDAEKRPNRASDEETDAGQGCQVVVELTEDEGGAALPLLRFA
jgi:hypothetical protein